MHFVFVYGTLLRGEPNHELLSRSRFLGEARTEPSYTLVDMGAFPAMIHQGSTSVVGEVFEVTDDVLDALDELEGHPDWYTRTTITLSNGIVAETYLRDPAKFDGRPVIDSGSWRERRRHRE
jgi:gamma-glutamylaminecyclotransferase